MERNDVMDEIENSKGICSKKILKTSDKRIDEYWHPDLPGVKFSVELYFARGNNPAHYRTELILYDEFDFFSGADLFDFTQLCLYLTWVTN
jgi:hypothetical protein